MGNKAQRLAVVPFRRKYIFDKAFTTDNVESGAKWNGIASPVVP
jgi:hypothetical protein